MLVVIRMWNSNLSNTATANNNNTYYYNHYINIYINLQYVTLSENQAKVKKSNSEITSIKAWLQTLISLLFQSLT